MTKNNRFFLVLKIVLCGVLTLTIFSGCTSNVPVVSDNSRITVTDVSGTTTSSNSTTTEGSATAQGTTIGGDVMNSSTGSSSTTTISTTVSSTGFVLPGLVGDNMILQRNATVKLWGKYNKDGVITATLNNKTYSGTCKNGNFEVLITTGNAGGPYNITLKSKTEKIVVRNVLLGEVFICAGQSNMQLTMSQINAPELTKAVKSNPIRFVYVPVVSGRKVTVPITELPLKWENIESDTLPGLSAVSYYFSQKMFEKLNVPIGILSVSAGGTIIASWLPNAEANALPPIYQDDSPPYYIHTPAQMFNTMLSPVLKYKARGVLWYQGENQYKQYDVFLTQLINVWRREFKNDTLGFTIIQLPGFGESWALKWPEIREYQKKVALTLPNCTYSVNIDLGEKLQVHPSDKKPVGDRAAYATLIKFFNMKNLPQSPYAKSFVKQGNNFIIDFANASDGLVLKNNGAGFELSADNITFYPATATVSGSKLTLNSSQVNSPIVARYAFSNFPVVSLYNKADMPAEQFNLK